MSQIQKLRAMMGMPVFEEEASDKQDSPPAEDQPQEVNYADLSTYVKESGEQFTDALAQLSDAYSEAAFLDGEELGQQESSIKEGLPALLDAMTSFIEKMKTYV